MQPVKTALLVLAAGLCARASEPTPPDWTIDWDATATGHSTLHLDGGGSVPLNTQSSSFSVLKLWRLSGSRWFAGAGPGADAFEIHSPSPLLPSRLEDVYAQLALERFEGAESVAGVIVNPGLYSGGSGRSGAWDMPVQAFSGVPILADLNGLVGFGNARFYHHAVPALGLIWEPTTQWRIEATYPTPSILYRPTRELSIKLGTEIQGGGFRTDLSGSPVVEYNSYRTGAGVRYAREGCYLELAGGIEAESSFDFFHENRRIHGGGATYGRVSAEWGF